MTAIRHRMIVVDVSTVKQHDCELAFSRSRLGPSPVLVQYLRGKTTAVLCQHASGGNVVDGRNFATSKPLFPKPERLTTPVFIELFYRRSILVGA